MIIRDDEVVELQTPTGPMRTYIFRPAAGGRYPGVVFFSEIFQVTGPIRRTAAFLAGHGFIVAVPEVYHELEPAGRSSPTTPPAPNAATPTRLPKRSQPTTPTPARASRTCNRAPDWHRQDRRHRHLPGRPPVVPLRHEPRGSGDGLLLCHRYSQAVRSAKG